MDSGPHPLRVYRIGYGAYEREVRVAYIHENICDWRIGMWVRTDRLYKLDLDDSVEFVSDVYDATEPQQLLKQGQVYTCCGWDDDGDVLLRTGKRSLVIFRQDFCEKMTLR